METFLFIAIFLLLYFIPTMVASSRTHPSGGGILMLNILLGWTFLGWAIALIWACSGETQEEEEEEEEYQYEDDDELEDNERECPFCAEIIKKKASICRFCSRDLPPTLVEDNESPSE